MVAQALNRSDVVNEAIAELIRERPDDPFPHIARLFLRGQSADVIRQRRLAGAAGISSDESSAESRASFRWLIDHRPDLRDRLTYGFVNELISQSGDINEAARVLSTAVGDANLDGLVKLAGAASRVGDVALQNRIFHRAIELAGSPADVPAAAPALQAILAANVLFSDDETYLETILSVLDHCLEQGEGSQPITFASLTPAPRVVQNVQMAQMGGANANANMARQSAFHEFHLRALAWTDLGSRHCGWPTRGSTHRPGAVS
jgi:hypothetical protein